MGIRVNIDLDIDSIFDEEFSNQINHYIRLATIQAIRQKIDDKTIQLIEDHQEEIDAVTEEAYKESHKKLMELYQP